MARVLPTYIPAEHHWMISVSEARLKGMLDKARSEGDLAQLRILRAVMSKRMERGLAHPQRAKPSRQVKLLPGWHPIVDDVCFCHKVSAQELLAGWKTEAVTRARHEIWWTLRQKGAAFAEIARRFQFHHTTVMHGVRLWQQYLDQQVAA